MDAYLAVLPDGSYGWGPSPIEAAFAATDERKSFNFALYKPDPKHVTGFIIANDAVRDNEVIWKWDEELYPYNSDYFGEARKAEAEKYKQGNWEYRITKGLTPAEE